MRVSKNLIKAEEVDMTELEPRTESREHLMEQQEAKPKKKKTKIQVKAPTQERSRQTVSTILEACSRILIREGFFGVTTDKIAKEAGVSIGSLYQFFGNKESVVSAVIHNLLEQDKQFVLQRFKDLDIERLPVEQKMRSLIGVGLEVYRNNSELRAKLQNIQMYLTDGEYLRSTMKIYEDMLLRVLPHQSGRDVQKIAYVAVTAFSGLMDKAVSDFVDVSKQNGLVDEIYRLFEPYLVTAAQPRTNA
jgi:AcrR family transcriptional regulator